MGDNVIGFAKPQSSLFEDDAAIDNEDNELCSSQLGRYAEFMVCAELTKLGYYVVHVDAPGFDLILSANDMSLRVQVKSSTVVTDGYCRWNCHKHQQASNGGRQSKRGLGRLTRADADLVALFHHQFQSIVFVPINEARTIMKFSVSQVRGHEAIESLERALAKLLIDIR